MKLISTFFRSRHERNEPWQGVTAASAEMVEFSLLRSGNRVAVAKKKEQEDTKNGFTYTSPFSPRPIVYRHPDGKPRYCAHRIDPGHGHRKKGSTKTIIILII